MQLHPCIKKKPVNAILYVCSKYKVFINPLHGSINAEFAPLYCLTLQKKPVNATIYVCSKNKVFINPLDSLKYNICTYINSTFNRLRFRAGYYYVENRQGNNHNSHRDINVITKDDDDNDDDDDDDDDDDGGDGGGGDGDGDDRKPITEI